MAEAVAQVITGVMPPQLGEARIREAYPSVARSPAVAALGRALTATIVLAPLAWLVMSALYFGRLLPLVGRRYTLTNRRLMIRTAWKGVAIKEVALPHIHEVPLVTDPN